MNITVETITDPALIYGTFILAGITFLGVILAFFLTRRSINITKAQLSETVRSNNLLRLEIENKLRPNILFADKPEFSKKSPDKTIINSGFVNHGNVPAKNFKYYIYTKSTKLDLDYLITQEGKIKEKESRTLGVLPVEFVEVVNTVLDHNFAESMDFWCAFWFEYNFLDVKDYEEIIIIHHTGSRTVEYFFHDKEQIDESRQRGGHSDGI